MPLTRTKKGEENPEPVLSPPYQDGSLEEPAPVQDVVVTPDVIVIDNSKKDK